MIGNWIKRKVQLAAVKGAREDLERFVLSLRGMSSEEIGTLVAVATVIRVNLQSQGGLPEGALGVGLPVSGAEHADIQACLSNLVRLFQKERQPSDAAGAMVWLHSLRSFAYPEIRLLCRCMWEELARGFPHAERALTDIEALTGKSIPDEAIRSCNFVPPGLEPDDREAMSPQI